MRSNVFVFDHKILEKMADGEEGGLCPQGYCKNERDGIVCNACYKKYGYDIIYEAMMLIEAYKYYKKGIQIRAFYLIICDARKFFNNQKPNTIESVIKYLRARWPDILYGAIEAAAKITYEKFLHEQKS